MDGRWKLHRGDCREFLKTLSENSVDVVVTDPPYELNFMGREWDRTGIAFDPAFWVEVLRVLKPGAHLLAAGIGRTHHRMMVAVEDAGFEIRDCIYHIFGSGFPKNLDVSKAIDKVMKAERPVVGIDFYHARRIPRGRSAQNVYSGPDKRAGNDFKVTIPATEEAVRWQGWGTALKPSVEIWVLARKPLSEKNVAENVLRWGTGALNIDGCRIPGTPEATRFDPSKHRHDGWRMTATGRDCAERAQAKGGRWPANLVLNHTVECGESCIPGCPVRLLDEQSGELKSGFMRAGIERSSLCGYRGAMSALTLHDTYGDSGGASRFFYCAKVSRNERWGWCRDCSRVVLPEELDVHREEGHNVVVHPTQKPLELMRWFVRLVTPPGGLVLDPFAGSGTTLAAAILEGFRCIGMEADPEYVSIAEARVKAACGEKVSSAVLVGDGMEQLTFF
ncbi:DNA methylase N-4/N-6 domain protein [Desulfofundulus kuznetsovii DSM 6115]|uniref:Methyltransferase n=1 Tax=Desulfofundulus kuznetsovii (strain DSM 6115 / VKM B-1805 / 17) TaxID=760568 RepID=A0AAU8Q184_DESK7|nr:DNA methylase N-4/N-6 domain protein [Desulfofundulus kuznetsovii DSM 6115]